MTGDQLRNAYLDFFKKQDHTVVPSVSLVPENDPTTLFTGSGMQPMMPYLLGRDHPEGSRIVDSQKCFRAVDIDEVGDNRHTTFFEMLGNWSLGDYFKKEQLGWFFTFLTQKVGLDHQRIFVSVFAGAPELNIPRDDEAVEIWKELFKEVGITAEAIENVEAEGMQNGRIFYYDAKKNWWSRAGVPANMPIGEPGGPDSEVFFDFGENLGMHEASEWKDKPCHPNCDCGRFLEIGNSVFMTYIKTESGFEPLEQKNIDFGGGLERILAAHNQDPDVFTTDLFSPIIKKLESIASQQYQGSEEVKRSFRVIADHIKAAVMLASDGVFPDNKEQGYFARRLVRRAIRYGKMIGIERMFIGSLVPVIVEMYSDSYPQVIQQQEKIAKALVKEEAKFEKTLEKGLREIEKVKKLDGATAFRLYETYGFPFELTQEIAQERGQTIDETAFLTAKKEHSESSRTASAGKFKGGLADHSEQTTQYHTATHLLHAALRQVLGDHVTQRGSNITADRLRFDFSHPKALTDAEKQAVADQINEWITQDIPVINQQMAKDDALVAGALAFFGEKYPDMVSVYTIGKHPDGKKGTDWISKELCGGPHVERTGEIAPVEIFKEKASSQGVRRLYLRAKS